MNRLIIAASLALALGMRAPSAEPMERHDASADELTEIGIGTLVGALLGGPPGAIVGMGGAAWVAKRDARKDEAIAELGAKLERRTLELARLKADFDRARAEIAPEIRPVAAVATPASRPRVEDELSLAVFFRTDTAVVDASLRPHLERLGAFLQSFPELNVRIEGHADRRGSETHNLALSRERIAAVRELLASHGVDEARIREKAYGETRAAAKSGDPDAMAFDRAVVISLSLDTEV